MVEKEEEEDEDDLLPEGRRWLRALGSSVTAEIDEDEDFGRPDESWWLETTTELIEERDEVEEWTGG